MTTVFFGGIPAGLTKLDVQSDFEMIGNIHSISLPNTKPIMFITFEEAHAAQKCVEHIADCDYNYRGVKIKCNLAYSRKTNAGDREDREAWMRGYNRLAYEVQRALGSHFRTWLEEDRKMRQPDRNGTV